MIIVQIRCSITRLGIRYHVYERAVSHRWTLFGLRSEEEWVKMEIPFQPYGVFFHKGFHSISEACAELDRLFGSMGYYVEDWSPDENES